MEKILLRGFGAFGILLFVPLFLFTFADPQLIENSAKSFIEWKLHQETDEKIDSIHLPEKGKLEILLGERAAQLRQETEDKLADIRQQLKNDAPAMLAAQIAKMRNLDCECRKKWEQQLRNSMQFQVTSLEMARSKLIAFTQAKYMDIVKKLTLDVRIFLASNAVIFIILFAVSFLKPAAIQHLFLPGTLMFISTTICSYFYLFEQNWFYTIIYNDYTGYGFIAYLLLVFAFLCDIVFNRARVSSEILNMILNVIGSTTNVSPC